MKSLKFPTPYTVLMLVIILASVLTYFLPAGKYETLEYNAEQKEFIHKKGEEISNLPGTQQTLTEKGIGINIKKFEEGKIKKPISIPNTYQKSEPKIQGI